MRICKCQSVILTSTFDAKYVSVVSAHKLNGALVRNERAADEEAKQFKLKMRKR